MMSDGDSNLLIRLDLDGRFFVIKLIKILVGVER